MLNTKQQPTDSADTPTVVFQVASVNPRLRGFTAEAFLWKAELRADVWASFLSYSCDKIPLIRAGEMALWVRAPTALPKS